MVVLAVLAVLFVLAVFVGLHRYLWHRLVRDTTAARSGWRRAGTAVFAGGPLLSVCGLVGEQAGVPFWLQQALGWPGFLWMAVFVYLLIAVVAGEAVRPLLRWALVWYGRRRAGGDFGAGERAEPAPDPAPVPVPEGACAPDREPPGPEPAATAHGSSGATAVPPPPDGGAPQDTGPSRRLLVLGVPRIVAGAAAAAALGTVGYGTYGVLRGPRVKHVTVPLAKLPRTAHGFRITVVSDIHLGPVLGRDFTRRVVATVNSTQPDLIAVVGDLVDGSVPDLGPAAQPLADLRARHGAYFVTGNHEYFSGAAAWVEHVRELGLIPLENARTELPGFDLAGVNDVAGESEGRGPDFGRALGDRDRTRTSVLLAHQPVVIDEAVRYGVDLQLSGHTHGGQLWPGNYIAELANPTVAGLERYGGTQLYVTRGAGAWGPPVRVGAPSDVTVVTLASRQA